MRYPNMDEFMRAMTDPVGYVEAHGGVGGFAGRQLMPSSAPLPSGGVRLTPAPMTPLPGLMSPVPGTLTAGMAGGPTPTTLSAAAGQVQPSKSKTPFVIAAVAVVALAGGGIFMAMKKKGGDETVAANDTPPDKGSETVVTMNKGSETAVTPPDKGSAGAIVTPPDKGSAAVTPPDKGSAAVTPPNTGSATPPNGAGSAHEVTVNKGSAAVEAQTASLTINSVPSGADIYINGKLIPDKKTPATLTLPRGDYKVIVKAKGFAEFHKAVSLKSDTLSLDAPLKAASGGTTGKGTGNKGSGSKACDTCLERPD
jgi:hypothetical protein